MLKVLQESRFRILNHPCKTEVTSSKRNKIQFGCIWCKIIFKPPTSKDRDCRERQSGTTTRDWKVSAVREDESGLAGLRKNCTCHRMINLQLPAQLP